MLDTTSTVFAACRGFVLLGIKKEAPDGGLIGLSVHKLSNIDIEKRTADCQECGQVKIKRRPNNTWRCKVGWKKGSKVYRSKKRYDRLYRNHKKDKCERCGFLPEHSCQLDVDHIDGNNKNDDLSNLQTLCANCHRLKTYINKDNIKQKKAPTQDFS